jgi:hypothetical protein
VDLGIADHGECACREQIALANKLARMAWAMMAKGECYREPVALAA